MAQKTQAEYEKELAILRSQLLEAQKAGSNQARLTVKVSEKGAISVYGLGRFPTTLYWSQWQRLFAIKGQIEKFAADNKAKLAVKPAAGSDVVAAEAVAK